MKILAIILGIAGGVSFLVGAVAFFVFSQTWSIWPMVGGAVGMCLYPILNPSINNDFES